MFGRNEVRGRDAAQDPNVLEVVGAPFATVQGEGPHAGQRAVFIRLAHCNLRCTFCDTDFTTGAAPVPVDALVQQALIESGREFHGRETPLVVITGGEPLRQPLHVLVAALNLAGFTRVQIETAGTLPPQSLRDVDYVVSPKTPRLHREFEAVFSAQPSRLSPEKVWLKYVVRAPADMAFGPTQPGSMQRLYTPPASWPAARVYVQPCDESGDSDSVRGERATRDNLALAARLCMSHGYVLSLQLHKIVGLP
jgi:organic radical activating enzyme